MAQPFVTHFFDVKRVDVVVRTYHAFKLVSLFEAKRIEMNDWTQDALASFILSNELDQFICYVLQVRICCWSDHGVCIQVHE